MMASAAYVGDFTTDDILSRKDIDGITVGRGARQHRLSRRRAGRHAEILGCFVELHIEQGPILEAENKTIGVVDSGQGVLWYDGKITGFESHAGSTPMPLRRDALATLSEIVLAMEAIAKKHGPKAVGTIGEAVIANPSRNVIPGEIAFTMDCRSADAAIMDALDAICAPPLRRSPRAARSRSSSTWSGASRRRISIPSWSTRSRTPRRRSAIPHRRITSGAGHDACNLNTVMPAAMVFVPCKDGISHNELEDATQADCAAGANVLMHTVLALAGVAS